MHDQDKTTRMFELVEQWQQSGLSQKQFLLEHDIKLATFGYWVKKHRQHQMGEVGFAKVELGKGVSSTARIEIELADGLVVRIF
jgi:transposase-like protein